MILVTGATGHYGKATIESLLAKGIKPEEVVALVRDEAKADDLKTKGIGIRIGDYDNYESLTAAFSGIDKLLLVSGSDIMHRGRHHDNAIRAAKEAGIKHIIYTSFERKNEGDSSPIAFISSTHLSAEKALKESGMIYTILRNNLYADMLPIFLGDKVFENGVFFPAGDTSAAFTLRGDMAEATANILLGDGHENQEYYFSNPEELSFNDVAGILSELSGRTVGYQSPDSATYVSTLVGAGMPQDYAGVFSSFGEAIRQGEFSGVRSDLEKLLGRKPTPVREYLASVYAS
jgi:NAD(P)H dehydrogenase (quinone)